MAGRGKVEGRRFGQLQPQRLVPVDQHLPVQFQSESGITVDLENKGDGVWSVTPSRDLNVTNFWNWNALRIQPVQREVYQKGARLSVEWGDRKFNLRAARPRTTSIAK